MKLDDDDVGRLLAICSLRLWHLATIIRFHFNFHTYHYLRVRYYQQNSDYVRLNDHDFHLGVYDSSGLLSTHLEFGSIESHGLQMRPLSNTFFWSLRQIHRHMSVWPAQTTPPCICVCPQVFLPSLFYGFRCPQCTLWSSHWLDSRRYWSHQWQPLTFRSAETAESFLTCVFGNGSTPEWLLHLVI